MNPQPLPPRAPDEERPRHYSGEKVRGAEIILRRPIERWIFLGGLAAFVILAIALRIVGVW